MIAMRSVLTYTDITELPFGSSFCIWIFSEIRVHINVRLITCGSVL